MANCKDPECGHDEEKHSLNTEFCTVEGCECRRFLENPLAKFFRGEGINIKDDHVY